VTCEITKRALLFEFHETLEFDGDLRTDPSVDLIVALERRDTAGLWIPNTERPGWDPSHPHRHTELFVNSERELRVHRARVIRLAKVAVKNDGEHKVMCSFNIEALHAPRDETLHLPSERMNFQEARNPVSAGLRAAHK
jgi:hypothetical protein